MQVEAERGKKSRRSKYDTSRSNISEESTPTALVLYEDLEGTSFFLPRVHVLGNMSSENYCEVCLEPDFDRSSVVCDGTRPSLFGHGHPDGANGRQFACHLGVICLKCEADHKKKKKLWFCRRCVEGPDEIIDAWSNGIRYPSYLTPPGVLHIESTPYIESDTAVRGHPCEIWDRILQRSSVLRASALRCRGDGESARRQIEASTLFFRRLRARAMSVADMESVLSVLHEIHDLGILLEKGCGVVGELTLPKSGYILESRTEGSIIQDEDIQVTEYKIDQRPLLQMQDFIRVWIVDLKLVLQTILLDDMFPPGSCFLQRREDMVRVLELVFKRLCYHLHCKHQC